jgi:hypothetical protein
MPRGDVAADGDDPRQVFAAVITTFRRRSLTCLGFLT